MADDRRELKEKISDRLDTLTTGQLNDVWSNVESLDDPVLAKFKKKLQAQKNVSAKGGFMGMIDSKTKFTVGEKGKREHVTRKKNNNIFDVGFKF